ncbi:ATP/GTP-binding protein [Thiohalocapsa sp. ML1]|uniref:AAA family ATPase n=1 Tax=Thiohalocapsa sp. ML1 TaxID=1431688 RepID=UPI000732420F|nr:ATP-binding protein [Thiohalocapsa sp. ML1]
MLIEFRVENHRSIRDEQALTLEAAGPAGGDDSRPRQVAGFKKPLLPAAALYGANASGKSNVLSALVFMRDAVMNSHRAWPPEGGLPRDPFAWGARATEPSLYEATFVFDGVRYRYGFVADDEQFLEEWLYAWPESRKQMWFERDGQDFKYGVYLTGENRTVAQVTRANALFLSSAAQLRHPQLGKVYSWFSRIRSVMPSRRGYGFVRGGRSAFYDPMMQRILEAQHRGGNQLSLFDDAVDADPEVIEFLGLLRAADVGIEDLRVQEAEDDASPAARFRGVSRRRVFFRHGSEDDGAWLPLDEESHGTQTLYRLGPRLLGALKLGSLMLVDEIESGMHPALAVEIVRQFNDPRTNPRNAQILFTSHDTHLLGNLLGEPALRRDQVWLTEKDAEGATCLYPLTDYKPRPAENLERGYLQGRYGAIPFLGDLIAPTEPPADDE